MHQGIDYSMELGPLLYLIFINDLDEDINSRIRYDTRCYFNVRSKADISQLNLPQA